MPEEIGFGMGHMLYFRKSHGTFFQKILGPFYNDDLQNISDDEVLWRKYLLDNTVHL